MESTKGQKGGLLRLKPAEIPTIRGAVADLIEGRWTLHQANRPPPLWATDYGICEMR